MNINGLVKFFFDWWHKATFNTRLTTFLYGEIVGEDDYGNRYFKKSKRKNKHLPHWNRESRWVIYNGITEASAVPPMWNAWLQHNLDEPPIETSASFEWEKDHLPNMTGTTAAYSPKNSKSSSKNKQSDYEPWAPE